MVMHGDNLVLRQFNFIGKNSRKGNWVIVHRIMNCLGIHIPNKHDGQTFIAEKAKQIHEQVESQREGLAENGEQVDDNQLYYDTVGGHDKKRRVYELGSYGCSVVHDPTNDNTSGNMTPISRPPGNATPTSANVQHEIQSLKDTILLMQQRLDAIEGGRAGTSSSPPCQIN